MNPLPVLGEHVWRSLAAPDDGRDCLDDEVAYVAGGDLLYVADGTRGHEGGRLGGGVNAPGDGRHVRQDEHLDHLGTELLGWDCQLSFS